MNAISFNADYVYLPIHKKLLESIGCHDTTDFEITPQDNGFLVQPKKSSKLTSEDEKLIEQIAGMFVLSKEQSDALEGSLFDFRVEDHITLFDESDDK
ncbi:hypothetical protein [Moraxella sp. ZY210820]|uniref:hypothetical protein n=1 Tax=unclassified Moraxella TaxID=2685852 RepID=UPI00272F8315|nr:hypothetical protein [Moraxella sp. ZY210820]WLF83221.1 hypothetical protein LU301_08080 [Moraxella sp. ZY210820]